MEPTGKLTLLGSFCYSQGQFCYSTPVPLNAKRFPTGTHKQDPLGIPEGPGLVRPLGAWGELGRVGGARPRLLGAQESLGAPWDPWCAPLIPGVP